MEKAWEKTVTPYARAEFAPVIIASVVGGVIVWILTTPLCEVGWIFVAGVWRVIYLNASMLSVT